MKVPLMAPERKPVVKRVEIRDGEMWCSSW
jgi:hypothetical protein